MIWSRRKPWRRYAFVSKGSYYIRILCCSVLTLELAFFAREMIEGRGYRLEEMVEEETSGSGETGPEEIYGIRFRFRDGEIQFYRQDYRQEELKSTN